MRPPLETSGPAEADQHRLVWAVWPADLHSPVRLFLALRGAGFEPCLLESAEGQDRLARYSFLGVRPEARLRGRQDGSELEVVATGERRAIPGTSQEALRQVASEMASPAPPRGMPPFHGGWVGWFSYEWASSLEPRVPRAAHDPWELPEAVFHLYREVVAFDHAAQRVIVMRQCPEGAAAFAEALDEVQAVGAAMQGDPEDGGSFRLIDAEPQPCMERSVYEAGVETLQEAIRAGEIFQAVLSQRFEQRFEGDPFTLYRVARLTNPSPHMFYFEAEGVALVGSSPERLVAVQGRRVQNRPIAGTRPRHEDPERDDQLALELQADLKERAEHDMLVDLARNDLGRIARIGTVSVKEHAALEKFARVQHLVSRVECDLAAPFDALDALAASFPAGTVSGAPKVRAMELLAQVETDTRGPYAGAFGYLDSAGNLDMAIAIRTLAVRGDRLTLQAGAGIVFDSVPAREYEETLHKSKALLEAVQLADAPTFQPSAPAAS